MDAIVCSQILELLLLFFVTSVGDGSSSGRNCSEATPHQSNADRNKKHLKEKCEQLDWQRCFPGTPTYSKCVCLCERERERERETE